MNAASSQLLQRYSALEYILLGDLRDVLEEPADAQNRKWLAAILDALLETLPYEFFLKEEEGYLQEVLDRYPNWANEVDQLRGEHDILFCRLKQLHDRVLSEAPFAEIAEQVREEVREWMRALIAHNRHELRLMQTAMNLEVGRGD